MADPTIAQLITPNPICSSDFTSLPIPPLDPSVFSEDFTLNNDFVSDIGDFVDDVGDFNFNLDDLYLPSENEDFLNPLPSEFDPPDSDSVQIYDDSRVSNSSSPEPGGINYGLSSDRSSSGVNVFDSSSPVNFQVSGDWSSGVDGFLNVQSPESHGYNPCSKSSTEIENHNPEVSGPASSQGSGNCGSDVSEPLNYASSDSGNCARSAVSSPDGANNSINGNLDEKIKLEDAINSSLLKRKKGNGDMNSELRMSKYRRSNDVEGPIDEEEEKKKARLMRNRESAQLSRQRKKHYVEELEDKLRSMVSQVQDMNSKISYLMAENANLRQHLGGAPMCPPPGMYPHPPMAPMGYPWMPYPPYAVKPNGSQVPLVPIPKLKPSQPVSVPKVKKVETKKSGSKTKKVASVSFLGLLLFMLFFGGLIPMVNVEYGDRSNALPGRSSYFDNRVHDQHGGWDFPIRRHRNDTERNLEVRLSNEKFTNRIHCGRGHPGPDESVHLANASGPMVASLYVPRNDKLVKIDGNLVIHSVLASEKAMASHETSERKSSKETGLAVAKNLAPVIPVYGSNTGRHHPHLYRNPIERQRALASGAEDSDSKKSKSADGKLQEWFREGLAGPLLHTGMCTEVFHFDVSQASAGAIVTANNRVVNISAEGNQDATATDSKNRKNRRILHGLPIPLPGSSSSSSSSSVVQNITKENGGRNPAEDNLRGNNASLTSSMVVSVLVDPREVSDSDGGGGVMGSKKSIPRIFVVVLIDSIKYVTYSCMLPLMGSGTHLVTT